MIRPWLFPISPPKRRLITLAGLATCALAARSFAQTPPIPNGATEAEIRVAAEHEGAGFPKLNAAPDSARPRSCIDAQHDGPARSGEFTIGGNLSGGEGMHAGREGKVWWAPVPSGIRIPSAGRWLLLATSGPNWGCFILTVV